MSLVSFSTKVDMKKLKKMQVTKQELDELEKVFNDLPEKDQQRIKKIAIKNYINAIKRYEKAVPGNGDTDNVQEDGVHLFEKGEYSIDNTDAFKLLGWGFFATCAITSLGMLSGFMEPDALPVWTAILTFDAALFTASHVYEIRDARAEKSYDLISVHPFKYLASVVNSMRGPKVKDEKFYNAERLYGITQQEGVQTPESVDDEPEKVVEQESEPSRVEVSFPEPYEEIFDADKLGTFEDDYRYR